LHGCDQDLVTSNLFDRRSASPHFKHPSSTRTTKSDAMHEIGL
jgi:hypothetical protein